MKMVSSYYPPRASWHRRWLAPWFEIKRLLHLDKLSAPSGLSPRACTFSLLVPGHAFSALGHRTVGRWILTGYSLAGTVFVVALGYDIANIAFGLMISAHVSSILFLLNRSLVDARLPGRIISALGVLFVVSQAIYWPALRLLEKHLIMPLRIDNEVVLVDRRSDVSKVGRGDTIAYKILEDRHDRLYVAAGYGIGPLLATAGDKVQFTPPFLCINGRRHSKEPGMPAGGEFVVPEKHWFIWPKFVMRGYTGVAGQANAAQLEGAVISQTQYIGRPFDHWFGRRQICP